MYKLSKSGKFTETKTAKTREENPTKKMDAKIAELEKRVADQGAEIVEKDAKIAELEKQVTELAKTAK